MLISGVFGLLAAILVGTGEFLLHFDLLARFSESSNEFSWGVIFEDFNLDGRDDLVVSENYIGFPPHKHPFVKLPGRFLTQTNSGEFAKTGNASSVSYTTLIGGKPCPSVFFLQFVLLLRLGID